MDELIKIFKIGPLEAEMVAKQLNEPHCHDFEELLVGTEGSLEHFIDFRSVVVEAPFVSFISQGKVHRVKPNPLAGKCNIWGIRFKRELIAQTTYQLYTEFHDKANIPLQADGCFKRLHTLCEMMHEEYMRPETDVAILRQLLMTLFTIIGSERRKLRLDDNESPTIRSLTFRNFLELLNKHYKEGRDVQFYADRLFMTPRNLNHICHSILQQSVSGIIETRRLTEAKNLLMTTDMPIAEIGFELGFTEKSHFSYSFKKEAGMTPTAFRREMKGIIA